MSAKSGENIDSLLENIMLVSEVIISLIYRFDSDRNLSLSILDECGGFHFKDHNYQLLSSC